MSRFLSLPLSISLMSAVALPAYAQSTLQLPTQVVTASRTSTPITDIIGDVVVIDADQLKQYQGKTLAEVLQSQSGISFKSNGGVGAVASVFMRGHNSQSTLVLIDGVRFSSLSTGAGALNLIPADQVSRIEILQGSASSLYGADAVGGVIQVFTKNGDFKRKNFQISVGAGTQNTQVANVLASVGGEKAKLTISGAHSNTNGISAYKKDKTADKDGHNQDSINVNFAYQPSKNTQLTLQHLNSYAETDIDQGQQSKQQIGTSNISLKTKFNNIGLLLSHGISVDKSDTLFFSPSIFNTKQAHSKLLLDTKLPIGNAEQVHKIIAGGEFLDQKLTSSTKFTKGKNTTASGLLGYQLLGKQLDAQANVRYDNNSDFGNNTTYHLGLAYEPLAGLRLGGSYATAFRAPTFNDRYYPFESGSYACGDKTCTWSYQGNPDLKPEKAKNAEVFVAFNTDSLTNRISVFQNNVSDLIASGALASGTPSRVNINKAKLMGVSLKTDYANAGYLSGLYYDYLDAKDEKQDKQLVYRAKHSAGAYLGYQADRWGVRGELNFTGKRFTDTSNKDSLSPYTLLNVSGSVALTPAIDFSIRVNNVLDTDYELSKDYNTLGRNALATITLKSE